MSDMEQLPARIERWLMTSDRLQAFSQERLFHSHDIAETFAEQRNDRVVHLVELRDGERIVPEPTGDRAASLIPELVAALQAAQADTARVVEAADDLLMMEIRGGQLFSDAEAEDRRDRLRAAIEAIHAEGADV